jgi:hypothetical protein
MPVKRLKPLLRRKRTVQCDEGLAILLKNPGFHNKNIAQTGGRCIETLEKGCIPHE